MASFTVIAPPADPEGERALFLRDGFSVFAFLLPLVWLLWRRLWLEAVLYLALMVGVTLCVRQGWVPSPAVGVTSLLASLYVGLEATTLRLAGLLRRGHSEVGIVQADDVAEAEIRWYAAHPGIHPAAAVAAPLSRKPAIGGPAPEPFMGLFDYSGDR
ncbi:MAG: DUF2628 domain-containing protein [Notoacmeibacter sp.]|nr:DUF2628 domain-containing protein [Notoacmeibacter sp.]